jgi:hypothetical protein
MMDYAIQLEACDPEKNIWRAYSIAAGQDLFGDWIVELTYGRIGTRGRTKTILLPDETATRRYVRQCLKKRESAPKRIGVGYTVKNMSGVWGDFSKETKDSADT